MDQTALKIIRRLNEAGYPSYLVGGCVRDLLLGRELHDWDIATAAAPEVVQSLFDTCIPTGLRHGTVTVLQDGKSFEVTTFRTDGAYTDSRHPDGVSFVRRPEEDLARRDFTVNAMAMDARGEILDPFGGREDLKRGILRCVGDPQTRFCEDALRMLRALRFRAQLGFTVHRDTMAALTLCAPLTETLSAERVRDELEKTLLSPRPDTVSDMARAGLLTAVGIREIRVLAQVPAEPLYRWSALFQACSEANWRILRLDKHTGTVAEAAAKLSRSRDRLGWKRVIAARGLQIARCAAALCGEEETVAEIAASGECTELSALAVSGKDFPDHGAETGAILRRLLCHVLEHPQDNRREVLLVIAGKTD